jgi:hypothetical protein
VRALCLIKVKLCFRHGQTHPEYEPKQYQCQLLHLHRPIDSRPDLAFPQDPAGVKALLDKLRSSQAWQETITSAPHGSTTPASASHERERSLAAPTQAASVADLLSLLHPSSSSDLSTSQTISLSPSRRPLSPAVAPPRTNNASSGNAQKQKPSLQLDAPLLTKEELQSCSFQQALSHLARLSSNPEFRKAVSDVSAERLLFILSSSRSCLR